MDNFGIFDFLSGLSKFYQENKADFVSSTDKPREEKTDTENRSFNVGDGVGGGAKTTQTSEKPSPKINDVPTVYFNQKLLDVIIRHDQFVKRVNEANPPKQPKKRTKKQPAQQKAVLLSEQVTDK